MPGKPETHEGNTSLTETGLSRASAHRGIKNEILNFLFVKRSAPFYARYTLHHHQISGLLEGICWAIIGLNSFVARRSLAAADWEISALASLPMVFFIFSVVWAQFMSDSNNSRFIILAGVFGRLSLIAFFFINSSFMLLVMIALHQFMHAVFLPAQSRIFQANYSPKLRGRAVSLVQSRYLLTAAIVAYAAGKALDYQPTSYHWLFPLAGLFGFWAYYRYILINIRGGHRPQAPRKRTIPFSNFFTVLWKDRRFLAYESFFFIYGLGFMFTLPLFIIFSSDVLNMNYRDFASSYLVVPQVIMLLLVPLFGRIMDRINPIRLCAIAFGFLAFWPLILCFTTAIWQAYFAYVFYGIGMAAVHVTWTLGALHFAPAREAQKYHAIHVTLVGLRASFGPWLAVLVFKPLIGFRATFYVGFTFFAISALLMLLLHARLSRTESKASSHNEASVS
jgi:MFS family permease